ncbi:hypothetical protein HUJ04_009432 [Dendroctonus ponderosae]|nr:hypothetical protein HUJ04_009432 [Dendroctonus ponderosae]
MVVTKMQNFFPHSFIHGRYILRPSVPAAPMSLTKRVSRKRPGHKGRQLMHIASYNVQTLSSEANILEIEVELNDIKWDIVGVSEVKRRGEDQITLRSGHTFHFKGEEDSSGGVGFFVHKKHIPNLKKIECVSPRVIYLVLRSNPVYAPTTSHPDEEIEDFYELVRIALHTTQTHFAVIIGDFNAKLGFKQDNAETALENLGYGERNERDIAVLSEISVGSDHRMIRAKTCFNVKRKKTKMILTNKSKEWKSPETITEYQQVVTRILEAQDYMEETDIEEINNNIQLDASSTGPRCIKKNERDLHPAVDTRWLTDDDDDDDDNNMSHEIRNPK